MKNSNRSIYDVCIKVKDQEQCDRLKNLCEKYELVVWEHKLAFDFRAKASIFCSHPTKGDFGVYGFPNGHRKIEVTESQFIEMLERRKEQLSQKDRANELLWTFVRVITWGVAAFVAVKIAVSIYKLF